MGWFREARACLTAALRRDDITRLHRARWQRLLGEAHQQLGAEQAARHHLEQALELLGHKTPDSSAGWLRVLAWQATQRLGGGHPAGRSDEEREAAQERAAAGFTIIEVYWVLQERMPVLPVSIRALNDAERAGDPDLAVRSRAGLGMVLGTLGRHRLARRQMHAVAESVYRTGDPLTVCWLGIVGGLHWTGTGDWAAVEAAAARVRELGRRTPMHRWADEVLLITAVVYYLTARYPQATAAAAEGLAAGRSRRDPIVRGWGLLVLIQTALRTDPADPSVPGWMREAEDLLPEMAGVDAARWHALRARLHLAAGDPASAWQAVRTADSLLGPRPSAEQYALEAPAGIAEVGLVLLDRDPAAAGLRTLTVAAVRRLHRYAQRFPMARPRALLCQGLLAVADGHAGRARRAWVRAAAEAEALGMPYELARAHEELGRRLPPGRRSALGLDRSGHLALAATGFETAGCHADLRRVRAVARAGVTG
jgi:tetratricopeptide (TPR) repeat protein